MKNKKNILKNLFIGSSIILLYFFSSNIFYFLLNLFKIDYNNLNQLILIIFNIIYELFFTFIIIYICKTEIYNNVKDFFKNFKMYFNKYFKYWILMLILMVISNYIVTIFTHSDISNNQNSILDAFKVAPIYTIILTVLIAPIQEELVFRFAIKKILNKFNFLFILISGILFGCLHVIGSLQYTSDLLFIIPYSIPGFTFAYIYTKSNNIFVPISIHFMHNGFFMLIQFVFSII